MRTPRISVDTRRRRPFNRPSSQHIARLEPQRPDVMSCCVARGGDSIRLRHGEIDVHGLIFFFIQKFAEKSTGGTQSWNTLRKQASSASKTYTPVGQYPDAEAISLLQGIAEQIHQ